VQQLWVWKRCGEVDLTEDELPKDFGENIDPCLRLRAF
jgi:hypothetical protein